MTDWGEKDQKEDGPPPVWVEMGRYAGFGITLAVATGLFLLVGWWVDQRLGTTPLFTILGALVGAGGAFYHMVQQLVLMPRERASKDDRGEERDR